MHGCHVSTEEDMSTLTNKTVKITKEYSPEGILLKVRYCTYSREAKLSISFCSSRVGIRNSALLMTDHEQS